MILLWVSFIVAIIVGVAELPSFELPEEMEFRGFMYWVFVVTFAISAGLIVFISRRHNWARIGLLLLTIAGGVATILVPPDNASIREWVVEIGCTAAELLALYWLFTGEGATWFSKRPKGAF